MVISRMAPINKTPRPATISTVALVPVVGSEATAGAGRGAVATVSRTVGAGTAGAALGGGVVIGVVDGGVVAGGVVGGTVVVVGGTVVVVGGGQMSSGMVVVTVWDAWKSSSNTAVAVSDTVVPAGS